MKMMQGSSFAASVKMALMNLLASPYHLDSTEEAVMLRKKQSACRAEGCREGVKQQARYSVIVSSGSCRAARTAGLSMCCGGLQGSKHTRYTNAT